MTKHCPVCQDEFKDTIEKCPDDQVKLVKGEAEAELPEEWVDLYAAANEIEAERLEGILEESGVPVQRMEVGVSQMPTTADSHSLIVVPQELADQAAQLVLEAREDGVISEDGFFYWPSDE